MTSLVLVSALVLPFPALARYHQESRTAPGRSEFAPGRGPAETITVAASPSPAAVDARPRGVLRKPEHALKLDRVLGIVRGMTHKLTNLSALLEQHLANVERRIAALQAAGHVLTVDVELAAARAAVIAIQGKILAAVKELDTLPDAEKPRTVLPTIRTLVRGIRAELRNVRDAFKTLREAIRDDVRAGKPSPSPSPSPAMGSVSPSPSPTALGSPSPVPSP